MSYGFCKPTPTIAYSINDARTASAHSLGAGSSSSAPVLPHHTERPRPHTAQVHSNTRGPPDNGSTAPKKPRKGYLTAGLNAASSSKEPQHRPSLAESRTGRISRQLTTTKDVCKAAFDLFDSNGSGCISEPELVRIMTRPTPSGTQMSVLQAKALFKSMDINRDDDGNVDGGVELREFAIQWKRDAKLLSTAAHASLSADFELAAPMLVMPYMRFKEQGRIWKSTRTWRADALRNGWLLTHEPGVGGLVTVYVSHRWWHHPPGRPAGVVDWGGPDHAEGAKANLKWTMLCAAVEALIARDELDESRVALWIDWQSIYQDDAEAKALGVASLLKITTLCRYHSDASTLCDLQVHYVMHGVPVYLCGRSAARRRCDSPDFALSRCCTQQTLRLAVQHVQHRYMLVPIDSPEIAAEAQHDPSAPC